MDDQTRIETIPEIIKDTLQKLKSRSKKEYTLEKFFEDACKNWNKLNTEDKGLFFKLTTTEEIKKLIKEIK